MQCFLIIILTHKISLCWWNRITMMPVIQLANKTCHLDTHTQFAITWEINSIFPGQFIIITDLTLEPLCLSRRHFRFRFYILSFQRVSCLEVCRLYFNFECTRGAINKYIKHFIMRNSVLPIQNIYSCLCQHRCPSHLRG